VTFNFFILPMRYSEYQLIFSFPGGTAAN